MNDTDKDQQPKFKELYVITADGYPDRLKVGIGDDAETRHKQGSTWHPPESLHLRLQVELENAERVEKGAKGLFGTSSAGGEWLEISPAAFKQFLMLYGVPVRKGGLDTAFNDPFWGVDPEDEDQVKQPAVEERNMCGQCKKRTPVPGRKTCQHCLEANRASNARWVQRELAKGKDGYFGDKRGKDSQDNSNSD